MAKMKTFAVDVEVRRTITVFVAARKPGGAEEKIQTEEGWREATAYEEEAPMWFDPKTMSITRVREVNS
jgi:hypothetical protein